MLQTLKSDCQRALELEVSSSRPASSSSSVSNPASSSVRTLRVAVEAAFAGPHNHRLTKQHMEDKMRDIATAAGASDLRRFAAVQWKKAPEAGGAPSMFHELLEEVRQFYIEHNRYPQVAEETEKELHDRMLRARMWASTEPTGRYIVSWEKVLPGNSRHMLPGKYIPGALVYGGTKLHEWAKEPLPVAPMVCMLCSSCFSVVEHFRQHVSDEHHGWAEYRKRVIFLQQSAGPCGVTAQMKRSMIQAHTQASTTSVPGQGSLDWPSKAAAVPVKRREVACVVCARLDWIEHRCEVALFADCKAALPGTRTVKDPARVDSILSVHRYCKRWPLIPKEELLGSSVRHPEHHEYLWLLHTRRVPLMPSQPADLQQGCAGTGDAAASCWMCFECSEDLCASKPQMPKYVRASSICPGMCLMSQVLALDGKARDLVVCFENSPRLLPMIYG